MREQYYLLGHPIGHSKSPAMHSALYKELGLDWHYGMADFETNEEAEAFLKEACFTGINITTPYKPLAFEAATIRAASAKLACGANVLVKKNDSLIAFNLDGDGCVRALEREGFSFKNRIVVVCGSGPTALAIIHASAMAGAKKVVMIGRDKDRSKKTLESYIKEFKDLAHATIDLPPVRDGQRGFREAYEDVEFSFGSYVSAKNIFHEADLVVNATPLGMAAGDEPPFDTDLLVKGQTVFDVVYKDGETRLIRDARERGCAVYNGSGMLVAQAVATAQVFFDAADVDVAMGEDEMFAIMAHAAGFE